MFGYYEITLPSSWQTKINAISYNQKNGGLISVGIMGFLSALIVGPCVAPPLAGALIYIGQTGDALIGAMALFVMSLGMGMPLLLIGVGAGKYMPKPGGWMTTVSKVFGVIMLFVAIWMLERVLPFGIIISLIILVLLGSAIYLLRYNQLIAKIVAILLLLLSFVVGYYYFTQNDKNHLNVKYIHTVAQLESEIRNSTTPVIVDFWANWCVSCKELDNITFKNKEVQKLLKGYKFIKIDVSKNTKDDKLLMKKFNIVGPPAILIYKDKKLINIIIGYKSPKELIKTINHY
jgi:thiol:disulfide interchange protein DsbD